MRLYLVHCGYYDSEVCDGIYESHTNFFIAADSFEDARVRAKALPLFQSKRMHVDGLQEIQAVQGHRVTLEEDFELQGSSLIVDHKHRDLALKK